MSRGLSSGAHSRDPLAPTRSVIPAMLAFSSVNGGLRLLILAGIAGLASSHKRHPPFRCVDRWRPQVIGGLTAMQRFSDFADCQECAGSRLFDFQRLFPVSSNQPDESVQYR